MNADCMECLLRRHLKTARLHGTDEQVTAFARDLMDLLANGPADQASPYFTPPITKLFMKHFGLGEDRYVREKEESNRFVLSRMEKLRSMVADAEDPLYAGIQLAILGNYIDFSALQGEVSFDTLDGMIESARSIDVDRESYAQLRQDLEHGRELLYLTDNAGEIGFDRVLTEEIHRQFPRLSITFCVRGGPTLNDATREDAAVVGIPFPVIDNGSRIPGTVLSEASDDLKQALSQADVVMAKGQANVETLYGTDHGSNLYFLFLIKCGRFMEAFGKEKFAPMLLHDRKTR